MLFKGKILRHNLLVTPDGIAAELILAKEGGGQMLIVESLPDETDAFVECLSCATDKGWHLLMCVDVELELEATKETDGGPRLPSYRVVRINDKHSQCRIKNLTIGAELYVPQYPGQGEACDAEG